jgi:hypothetical protein
MRKALILILLILAYANVFSQALKSRPEYEEVFADSMCYYLSKAIPSGWSIKRYDRRLVLSRKDSVYLQFDVPLNSPYIFDNDTTDGYRSYPKYKFQIYVDFPLEEWTDSAFHLCQVHNDSIQYLIEQEVKQSRKKPIADQMGEHVRIEKRLTFLDAQLINLPIAITNWFGIYMSDNCPKGCLAIDTRAEGRGSDAVHKVINKEIAEVKNICTNIIKAHLKIQYKY